MSDTSISWLVSTPWFGFSRSNLCHLIRVSAVVQPPEPVLLRRLCKPLAIVVKNLYVCACVFSAACVFFAACVGFAACL